MSTLPSGAPPRLSALALALFTLAAHGRAHAQDAAEANAPPADTRGDTTSADTSVATLDQRLRVLERKLELQAEDAAAKAAKDPVASLSSGKGLSLKSPASDGIELKLKGLVQADGRFYLNDEQLPQNDGFLLRRVRPTLEGSWGPLLGFRLTPEFAGDSATVVDAYLDLKFSPRASVRIGKVKGPIGLERLQSGGSTALIERGFATELAPNRDLGVQLQGELFGNTLNYVIGAYNGAPDGRDAATSNPDNELEYAGRVFWEPFKNRADGWSGLGLGLAASAGDTFGSGNNFLPRYRTPGQVQFFGYGANVAADGLRRRWSPQGYFYRGAFGLLGEYITSEQELRVTSGANLGRREHLRNDAWNLTAGWVLTGEDAGYKGVARPNRPFTPGAAGWGAFELVARYGEIDVDDDAFPLFANPTTSASGAQAWGLGLNWYLTGNLKLVANYTRTTFERGALGGDREDEQAFFTRAQLSF